MTHSTSDFSKWTNPVEILPMEGTDAADRAKEQAFEALEFFSSEDDGRQRQYVKCQSYGQFIHIVGKLQRPTNDRMAVLQKRISHMEKHSHGGSVVEIKKTKEELQALEAEESQRDRLRSFTFV